MLSFDYHLRRILSSPKIVICLSSALNTEPKSLAVINRFQSIAFSLYIPVFASVRPEKKRYQHDENLSFLI